MRSGAGVKSPVRPRLHSVKDLLEGRFSGLARLAGEAQQQEDWSEWLTARLAPELAPRISGIHERDGILVVFAESAAWSARLRFALEELQSALRHEHPRISGTEVRVLPRS